MKKPKVLAVFLKQGEDQSKLTELLKKVEEGKAKIWDVFYRADLNFITFIYEENV